MAGKAFSLDEIFIFAGIAARYFDLHPQTARLLNPFKNDGLYRFNGQLYFNDPRY